MTDRQPAPEPENPSGAGATTASSGTPLPVDFSADRRTRITWVALLGGPVVWFAHFMVVYLIVEAGCTGSGPGLNLFNPPVPAITTLAFTAAAILVCLGLAGWAFREWRAGQSRPNPDGEIEDVDSSMGFAGFLLSLFAAIAIAFVGLPALVLPAC